MEKRPQSSDVKVSSEPQTLRTAQNLPGAVSIYSSSVPPASPQLQQHSSHSSSIYNNIAEESDTKHSTALLTAKNLASLHPDQPWDRESGCYDGESLSSSSTSQTEYSDPDIAYFGSPGFMGLLGDYGSFMDESCDGISDESKELCSALIECSRSVPDDTAFEPDRLSKFVKRLRSINEAMVSRELAPLLIPSLTSRIVRGAQNLEVLAEAVDELWHSSVPLFGHRPKPDYSLGFGKLAFTPAQRVKLAQFKLPSIDTLPAEQGGSYTMATGAMYFPFFTGEIKRASGRLDIADLQNTESATIALQGLIRLLRAANREMEAHRQTLFFSIAHTEKIVSIYGYYPVIQEENTFYHCHLIKEYFIFADGGLQRWQSYMFVKNLQDNFAPKLRNLISTAIDDLITD